MSYVPSLQGTVNVACASVSYSALNTVKDILVLVLVILIRGPLLQMNQI